MFTVVIPLYNKAHTIEKTLASVLNQTFHEFEVVIVNDGSTDHGVEVIRESFNDPRIRIIDQCNQGVSVARNNGIASAKYEYIAFLDGDDEWLPNYLEKMRDAVIKFPQAGMICCAGYVSDKRGMTLRLAKKFKGKISQIDYFENPHVFTHVSATVITKKAFENTNGFPVKMKRNEDFAFLFSVALKEDVVYCGYPLSIYRGDVPGQVTASHSDGTYKLNDVANRINLCHDVWVKTKQRKKLFLVFEKYEIRHIILVLIHRNEHQFLKRFLESLSENVLNSFSKAEILLWKNERLRLVALTYIYISKIIWRLHGFPVTGRG